jgi:hypothetical protein
VRVEAALEHHRDVAIPRHLFISLPPIEIFPDVISEAGDHAQGATRPHLKGRPAR